MKIDGSLARNVDFEVADLEVPKKTRARTSILKLQSVKIEGGLARNARFDAPTCLVSSLWFSCGLAVSMGEAAKHRLFEGFQTGCHVAALCDIPTCLITCRKSFCRAGPILLRPFHKMSSVFVAGATFWKPLSSFCVTSAALQTCRTACSTLHTRHSTLHPLHSTLHTPHSTLHTPHFTLHTPHSTL